MSEDKITDYFLQTDWLRKNAIMAHYFGLGFIQVKLESNRRVHFYHPDIPAFVENPHNHRYGFFSKVLKGSLTNRIYNLVPGEEYRVFYDSCKNNKSDNLPQSFNSGLKQIGEFITNSSSGYYINSETLHTVHPDFSMGSVITFIERESPTKDFAKIVEKINHPSACPFSRPMDDEEIWKIVDKCINN